MMFWFRQKIKGRYYWHKGFVPLRGYLHKSLEMDFLCLLCIFFCLSFVPWICYWCKGLTKTFVAIHCSRRLKHLVLRNLVHQVWEMWRDLKLVLVQREGASKRVLAQTLNKFLGQYYYNIFILFLPIVRQIWYWHQGLKSCIRLTKYKICGCTWKHQV